MLLGKVTIVQGLFFGLKAAVLVIVVEAVLRVGKRALKNNMMRGAGGGGLRRALLLRRAVPDHRPGRRPRSATLADAPAWPAFLAGGGHGKVGAKQLADADSLLGEETPEHARPNLRWSLSITAVFLALWLVPVAALYVGLGGDNVFTKIAIFFSKMAVVTFGGAYAVLAYVAQQAVDTLSLGDGRRDAGRTRHGRDDARPADHGDAVRGLPRRLARAGRACRRCWPRRWAACSPPGSPSRPASSGSSSARPSSRRCAPTRRLGAALGAITAAVVGVILNLAVWFALHVLFAKLVPVHWLGASVDLPVLALGRRAVAGPGDRRRRRDLPLQDRHDSRAAGELAGRHRLLPRRRIRLSVLRMQG